MKKIVSLLMFIAFVAISNISGQAVTNSMLYVDGSAYGSYLGATTDTIIASGYRIQPMRLKGERQFIIDVQLSVTKVSGTVTNNFIMQKSLDNTNWVGVDTIKLSNASTGVNYKQFDNVNYPYIRFYHLAPATAQKAYYKVWYVIRQK